MKDRLKEALEKSPLELEAWEIDSLQQIVKEQQQEIELLKEENDTIPQLQQTYMVLKGSHDKLVDELQEAKQEIKEWERISDKKLNISLEMVKS